MLSEVKVVSVEFVKYKAFSAQSVSLRSMNIVVGPNNGGKSTMLGAFRVLAVGIRRAWHKNPELLQGPDSDRKVLGYTLAGSNMPISLENVHFDYEDVDSFVTFNLSNKNRLQLYFPKDGGCILIPITATGRRINRPTEFRSEFPISIAVIPVLGPVEHKETILSKDTILEQLNTHRASRHFRNYWYQIGKEEEFDVFAERVSQTWPGMEIMHPNRVDALDNTLVMYALEDRIKRELAWCGSGFQVWCQILTHIGRVNDATLVVVDEPEIYLHPDVQRQLIGLLRKSGPDVLLATHSTEIMSEADPDEIILVDKHARAARRLRDIPGVQAVLNLIGSAQNITFSSLARNNRIIFVEDLDDFKIIRRFADRVGLSNFGDGGGITPIKSGGFSSWERVISLGWGLDLAMQSSLLIGVIYDRDYRCDEETSFILEKLREHTNFAYIHSRKEIENYMLVPTVLDRAVLAAIEDRAKRTGEQIRDVDGTAIILERLTDSMKSGIQAKYIARRVDYLQKTERNRYDTATLYSESISIFESQWSRLEDRLKIVPGKEVLGALRTYLRESYVINISDASIISRFKREEIPDDLVTMINALEHYRTHTLL